MNLCDILRLYLSRTLKAIRLYRTRAICFFYLSVTFLIQLTLFLGSNYSSSDNHEDGYFLVTFLSAFILFIIYCLINHKILANRIMPTGYFALAEILLFTSFISVIIVNNELCRAAIEILMYLEILPLMIVSYLF